jgi:hypothetical protein
VDAKDNSAETGNLLQGAAELVVLAVNVAPRLHAGRIRARVSTMIRGFLPAWTVANLVAASGASSGSVRRTRASGAGWPSRMRR